MPTILLLLGWRIFFYANEGNEPAHVHCRKGEKECKYWLDRENLVSKKPTPTICRHAIGGKSRKSSSNISNTLSNNGTSLSGGVCDETISPSDRSSL
jgi:Domain of unknown function (DUF4160)